MKSKNRKSLIENTSRIQSYMKYTSNTSYIKSYIVMAKKQLPVRDDMQ